MESTPGEHAALAVEGYTEERIGAMMPAWLETAPTTSNC